jgi:hypothetical protein
MLAPKRNTKKPNNGVVVSNRKKTARSIRPTSRQNQNGTQSTHVMEWGGGEGRGRKKYTVNPTIFPNKDGSWTDLGASEDRMSSYKEAKKRGEVFGFRSAKIAEKFAAGSWKKGQDKKDAMKNYRIDKKQGLLYTQSKDFKQSKKTAKKK